jgi:hypothetical protein
MTFMISGGALFYFFDFFVAKSISNFHSGNWYRQLRPVFLTVFAPTGKVGALPTLCLALLVLRHEVRA